MLSPTRPAIPLVLEQHQQAASALIATRKVLVSAPHVKLHQLGRLDERLAAHLDGLTLAGPAGERVCEMAMASPLAGDIFAAAVHHIESRNTKALGTLLLLTEALAFAHDDLVAAFGWVHAAQLQGIIKPLLDSAHPAHRRLGLLACSMHLVNPGKALESALIDPSAPLRTTAFQVACELGRQDLLESCLGALDDDDPACQQAATLAAVRLGDRGLAWQRLSAQSQSAEPSGAPGRALFLRLADAPSAHAALKSLSTDPAHKRLLIRGIGAAGDPHYVPWLIKQMSDLKLTRLAGESFSLITGLDLAFVDLDCKPPEKLEFGPNDDPADADVAMDEDDSLPWPDPEKIAAWWAAHGARFKPGTRYFVGDPPSVAHCRSVLRGGFQRQRIAAAEYLCLLSPGTPLFNTAAPAWRQERLLAQMEA